MCYYVGLVADIATIKNNYGVPYYPPIDEPSLPSGMINGFGHPKLPIIKREEENKLVLGEWGLIPHWAKDISQFRKGANTLNAMIETVAEKPSYRDSINRRCLVVVSEFYEYRWMDEKGKVKILHNVKAKGKDLFSLAGIYSPFKDPESGEWLDSYTILTTEANNLMAEIHNTKKRMPVVLHTDEEALWLNNEPIEHYFSRKEIELEATPLPKPGQEMYLF